MDLPHQTWQKVSAYMLLSGAAIGLPKDCNGTKNDFWCSYLNSVPLDIQSSRVPRAVGAGGKMGLNIPPILEGDVKSHFIPFFIARSTAVESLMVKSCDRH